MSSYLNLVTDRKELENKSLKEAIIFIGKHYGKLASDKYCSQNQYLNSGINYISKPFGRFNKTAIKNMFISTRKTCGKREWRFKKSRYHKFLEYIINLLDNVDENFAEEANKLLKELLTKLRDDSIDKTYSNALIYHQKVLVSINTANSDTEIAKESQKLYREISRVDKPIH